MGNKRIILLIGVLLIVAGLLGFFLLERDIKSDESDAEKSPAKTVKTAAPAVEQTVETETVNTSKADLYTNYTGYLPFVSVVEIANLPDARKQKIDAILELSQGCYYLKAVHDGKIFIILQNPVMYGANKFVRHNMQIAEIEPNGTVTYKNLGFSGEENEVENAILPQKNEEWVFDESIEPVRPLKHVVYDKKKKVLYSEMWNYDSSESIKYEMKDSEDKTVSIMKEIVNGENEYRQEHVFYDESGNVLRSITINYDGANIKWFTYYDSKNPERSVTIESEYGDGNKVAEYIYNQNYKLTESFKADYNNGDLRGLRVFDSDNKEILRLENQ